MQEPDKAMGELLNICLHDFLNVLQVVGGLVQLNKTDRVMTYIRNSSEEFQQFGRLINCGDPRLALLLYQELLQDLAGKYFLDVKGVLPLLSAETLEALKKTLQILRQQLKQAEEGSITVKINGTGLPAVSVSLSPEKQQPFCWEAVIAVAREAGLKASVRQGVHLLLNLDNSLTGSEQ